jgi:simple sugar transport system permease protein
MTAPPDATKPPPQDVIPYAAAADTRAGRPRRVPPIVWPIAALLTMLVLNISVYGRFTLQDGRLRGSLIDVIDNAAPVAIVSLGMTLVIATGGIDLSVGAIMAIAGTVAALLVRDGQPIPLAVIAALGAGVVAGAWNGVLVAFLRVQPLVATLVLMVAGRGVAMLLSEGQHVRVNNPSFDFIGGGFLLGLPFSIAMTLTLLAVIALLTRRTAAGLFIESVGDNPTAARFAGVHEPMVKLWAYVASGFCSALAGLIATSDIREADANHIGLYVELDAILAVVIGGTALVGGRFSLVGSIVGALIVQAVTTTILTRGVAVELTQVVKAVVVVAVALLQSPRFVALVTAPFRRRGRIPA